jgi:ketosteroid isomerase-like protein
MAGELESLTRQYFEALDRKDAESIIRMSSDDAQGVDEISRRWLRGIGELGDYLKGLVAMVDEIQSTISAAHEIAWGDTGLVTCWLEQDYKLDGNQEHVSAPTTVVCRRQDGAWKVALFHSIPLPPESA